MANVASAFRSFVECISEERWQDLTSFASFPLDYNGEDIGASEALADKFKAVGYGQLEIDAITVDEQSQRLGATLVAKLHSAQAATRDLTEQMQIIAWTENEKLSKVATLVDDDDVQRQLSEPGYVSTPNLISAYSPNSTGTTLSKQELEDTYRTYISFINAQTMVTDLPRFCHPHVTHNAKRLSLDEYRALIQEAFTAVPDIVFGVDAVVADEKAQRIAVRLEFTGTPMGRLSGAEPTGRSVRFYEYVTYAFRDGKIDRVWSIVDWKSYRQQLLKK
ncbi:SnoaL-like polyketide cyclase-domain-containing protein [Xylaria sp. FL0043]|nr:SnoaL-like polyketide cyclase-domain-containing protein [Xylaria sp. FL0043]